MTLKAQLRRAFGRFALAVLRPPRAQGPIDPASLRSILVIRVDERVGNVLLTTPLVAALQSAFPRATVDVLVAASKRAILDATTRAIAFEKRALFVRPWAFAKQLLALRRAHYDLAIDASHWHEFSLSSALLLAWTGAPLRIAHARGDADRFATHAVAAPVSAEREVTTKLRLLAPLGLTPPAPPLSTALGTSPAARAWADRALADLGLAGLPIAGLVPGARKVDHRASEEVFVGLARAAFSRGARALVLWGPGEQDLAERVARAAGASCAPPSDLEQLAALMRACRAVVTNDTGPMHLAVATGTPTIALFTQADHARWGHPQPPHAVIPGEGLSAEALLARATAALEARLAERGPKD